MSCTHPTPLADDNVLVSLIASGDQAAFSHFMRRHLRPVATFSTRFLSSKEDGEDVVQAVFLDVWRKAGQFDQDKANARTWLYRIARNRCIDTVRWRRLQQFISFDHDVVDVAEEVPSALQGIVAKRDAQAVVEAITQLPDRQRMALLLSVMSELPVKHIAEVMKTSEGAVEQLVARARRSLRLRFDRQNRS